jgi:hypothetical protein
MNNEKIKLDEIENGDKLKKLIELLPALIKYAKNKDKIYDTKPTDNSEGVSLGVEK